MLCEELLERRSRMADMGAASADGARQVRCGRSVFKSKSITEPFCFASRLIRCDEVDKLTP
jgi:hypothetical protein